MTELSTKDESARRTATAPSGPLQAMFILEYLGMTV